MSRYATCKLADIGILERGRGLQKNDFTENGTPCIHYGQIFTHYKGFAKSTISFMSPLIAKTCTPVHTGDIILAITSENVQDLCKSVVWLGDNDIVTGGHSGVFRHNQNPKFLGYFFQSKAFQRQKAKYVKGTKVIEITPDDILNRIKINLPDLETQQKIVQILDTLNEIIVVLQKLIDKERIRQQSLGYELLFRRAQDGEPYTLKDLFDFKNGYTPSKKNKEFWVNGTVPWFRLEDIRKNGRRLQDSIQHVATKAVKGKVFPANSIIMSTTATIGEYAWVTTKSLANQQFTYLSRKESQQSIVDVEYFYHYCSILSAWCKRNVNAGGLLAVDMQAFMNYKIPLPSIKIQQSIAQILTAQEEKINSYKREVKLIKCQYYYLLNHLIAGDLDPSGIKLETEESK